MTLAHILKTVGISVAAPSNSMPSMVVKREYLYGIILMASLTAVALRFGIRVEIVKPPAHIKEYSNVHINAPQPLCPNITDSRGLHSTLKYLVKDLGASERLSRTNEGKPARGIQFLSNYKNPCWLEELPRKGFSYPRTHWITMITDKKVNKVQRKMTKVLRGRDEDRRNGFENGWRLRCLPYLYIIGMHKAGTTDLFNIISTHPHITVPLQKEPQFWSRLPAENGISKYLDFYDEVSETIRRTSDKSGYHGMITLDASTHTYQSYYREWRRHPWNNGTGRQCIFLPQHLSYITPQSKYVFLLRNPEKWIVSCVNFFYHQMRPLGYSSESLHTDIQKQIKTINDCITRTGDVTFCTYEMSGKSRCNLGHMMYYVWAKLWLDTAGKRRILFLNADVYFKSRSQTLKHLFDFLDLPPISESLARKMSGQRTLNKAKNKKVMLLPKTKTILLNFLQPWNAKLAELLSDRSFLWNAVTRSRATQTQLT